jgi:VanZ family protein
MAFIFYLSSISSPPGQDLFPGQDKVEHFVMYLVLGVLLSLAMRLRSAGWSTAAGCAYSVTDELHQHFVPGRTADVLDVLVDSAAVAAGVALTILLLRRQDSGAER